MAKRLEELLVRIGANVKGAMKGFNAVEGRVSAFRDNLSSAGRSMQSAGGTMTKGLTLPILGFGAAAITASEKHAIAMRTIRSDTGATGEALAGLEDVFRNVARSVPNANKDVADAVAELNTRLGLQGPLLEKRAKQFLSLAKIQGGDVKQSIATVTRVFGDWGVVAEEQEETLDKLFRVSQATGIGMDSLTTKVVQFGAPMRQMGFSLEESVALLGKWEKEGVNTERILGSLSMGVARLAQEGITAAEMPEVFRQRLEGIKESADPVGKSIALFGTRAGPDMAAAITEGRFSVEELMATLDESTDTIAGVDEETRTFTDHLRVMGKGLMESLEPFGKAVKDVFMDLRPTLETFTGFIAGMAERFSNLPKSAKLAILAVTGIAAALGPALIVVGAMVSGLAALISPIGAVLGIVAGLAGVFGVAAAKSDGFLGALQGIAGRIGEAFSGVGSMIAEKMQGVLPAVAGALGAVVDAVGPLVEPIMDVLSTVFANSVSFWTSVVSTVAGVLGDLQPVIEDALGFVGDVLGDVGDAVGDLLPVFAGLVKDGLAVLIPAVQEIAGNILPLLMDAVQTLLPPLLALAKVFLDAASQVLPILLEALAKIIPFVFDLVDVVVSVMPAILDLAGAIIEALVPVIGALLDILVPVLGILVDLLGPILKVVGVVAALLVPVIKVLAAVLAPIIKVVGKIIALALTPLRVALALLGGDMTEVKDVVVEVWGKIKEFLATALQFILDLFTEWHPAGILISKWDEIREATSEAWGKVKEFVGDALRVLLDLFMKWHPAGILISKWDEIKEVFSGAFDWFKGIGKDIMRGMAKGIADAADAVKDAAGDAWKGLTGGVEDFFDISSPSKLFAGYGENIMQGLQLGLDRVPDVATGIRMDLTAAADGGGRGAGTFVEQLILQVTPRPGENEQDTFQRWREAAAREGVRL